VNAPASNGNRLGLVFGHSLAIGSYRGEGELVSVGGVELLDCGRFVALSRHGFRRFTPAHLIDHHANVAALAELGCERVVALASTGSLRTDWGVGTVVAPDDFVALTVTPSFFADARGHSVPGFDADWRATVVAAWTSATDVPIVDGGVYVQTTGPRFETPAEIKVLAGHGDIVGMTLAAEVILMREAGLAFAAVCTIDNLANGLDAAPLTVEEFRSNKAANEERMRKATDALIDHLSESTP
jgi:5'-methylthioadenosine phosphorylase